MDRNLVVWGYRLFLDREPESDDAVAAMQTACSTTRDLRRGFMASPEFRAKNPDSLAYTPECAVVIAQLPGSLRLFVDLADIAIGLNIARGVYEPQEIEFVRTCLRRGQRVLDIGANVGFFSITMADLVGPEGHVYAFEPLEQNAALLRRSVIENRMEGRITVRGEVVGDRRGRQQLVSLGLDQGAMNSGGAYLLAAEARVPTGHRVQSVPMVTLDSEEFRSPVSFIKIDVEGAEPLVFRGGRRLLERDRPTILCEINPTQLERVSGSNASAFMAEMRGLGYGCFALVNGRPEKPIQSWKDATVGSVVFLPRSGWPEVASEKGGQTEITPGSG